MTKAQGISMGAAVALGVVVLFLLFGSNNNQNQNGTVSNAEDQAIRTVVADVGARMKQVSLLAPDASAQIAAQYGALVTPELLAAWQAKPENAPGRETSSPWPERIEVTNVSHKEVSATVQGNVIEVTNSDDRGYAALYPVTITLEKRDDRWLISDWRKGTTQTPPERISVVGYWECLPKKGPGPHTMECVFGIAVDQSDGHYAINTSLMSTYPVDYATGQKVRVSGTVHPAEPNTSYDIDGVIWATTIEPL